MTLADAAPPPNFMGNLVLAFVSICSIASTFIAAIALRRHPPLGEEIKGEFLRRKEWSDARAVLDDRIDDTHSRINALNKTTSEGFTAVERALGRIEGELRSPEKSDRLGEIEKKMDDFIRAGQKHNHPR